MEMSQEEGDSQDDVFEVEKILDTTLSDVITINLVCDSSPTPNRVLV